MESAAARRLTGGGVRAAGERGPLGQGGPLPASQWGGRGGAGRHGKRSPQRGAARGTTGNVVWREPEGSPGGERGAAGRGGSPRGRGLYEVPPTLPAAGLSPGLAPSAQAAAA